MKKILLIAFGTYLSTVIITKKTAPSPGDGLISTITKMGIVTKYGVSSIDIAQKTGLYDKIIKTTDTFFVANDTLFICNKNYQLISRPVALEKADSRILYEIKTVINPVIGNENKSLKTALENRLEQTKTIRETASGDFMLLVHNALITDHKLVESQEVKNYYFGPSTTRAVMLLQKERGLVPDGIIGNKTKKVIISILENYSDNVTNISDTMKVATVRKREIVF